MRKKKITTFCDTELVDYASYSTLRMIASAIDGQKNTSRKIINTVIDKNIKEKVKVSQLSSKMAEYTEFLHGDASGPIITLAQSFAGSNNLPLLATKGNFGNRFSPVASAPRYIYAYGGKNLFRLFDKNDNNILVKQYFEGSEIEPLFYTPNLPILLINGAGPGMASGFKQMILPRDPEQLTKLLKQYLEGTNTMSANVCPPYFDGFNGDIQMGETHNQWLIKGLAKKMSASRVMITEIPVGIPLKTITKNGTKVKGYIDYLDGLEEDKVIKSYKDMSTNDTFKFEVTFSIADLKKLNGDKLLTKLGLIKKVSELYTALDEDNQVRTFNNIAEIFDYYYDVKLRYMQKRKDYIIQQLTNDIDVATSKYNYIVKVIDDDILLKNKTKIQIVAQIDKCNDIIKVDNSYNYLINMPMHSVSKDTLKELKDKVAALTKELKIVQKTTLEQMWLNDLEG